MDLYFTGYKQSLNTRRYGFDRVGTDRTRTPVTVSADVSLLRKHAIALQELPLLCRRLLEELGDSMEQTITFTEEQMADYASRRACAQAETAHKRANRRPSEKVGAAWRGPQH